MCPSCIIEGERIKIKGDVFTDNSQESPDGTTNIEVRDESAYDILAEKANGTSKSISIDPDDEGKVFDFCSDEIPWFEANFGPHKSTIIITGVFTNGNTQTFR